MRNILFCVLLTSFFAEISCGYVTSFSEGFVKGSRLDFVFSSLFFYVPAPGTCTVVYATTAAALLLLLADDDDVFRANTPSTTPHVHVHDMLMKKTDPVSIAVSVRERKKKEKRDKATAVYCTRREVK